MDLSDALHFTEGPLVFDPKPVDMKSCIANESTWSRSSITLNGSSLGVHHTWAAEIDVVEDPRCPMDMARFHFILFLGCQS